MGQKPAKTDLQRPSRLAVILQLAQDLPHWMRLLVIVLIIVAPIAFAWVGGPKAVDGIKEISETVQRPTDPPKAKGGT
ncbi:hypothetical protein EON81_27975 [bacterium]|nr:MAG: hypothetical protein EON81_27975 [bacterium]